MHQNGEGGGKRLEAWCPCLRLPRECGFIGGIVIGWGMRV